MTWYRGISPNEVRDTWADDFFAIFNREEARRKREAKEIDDAKKHGHQGKHGNIEYVKEDEELQDSKEVTDFMMEGEEYTGE